MANSSIRTGKTITCKVCKTGFYAAPWEMKRRKGKMFCSKECSYKGRTCTMLFKKGHADLVPKSSRGHSEETKKKMRIANSAKALKTTGERHYRWLSDRTQLKDARKDRGGQLHREWSKTVKNRDGWKCRTSNSCCSGRVVAHHIKTWQDHPELRYEVNNGITLCHVHHPRKRNDERKLETMFKRLVLAKVA